MSSCNPIRIAFESDEDTMFENLKSMIESHNGQMSGNKEQAEIHLEIGSFHPIKGRISIQNQTVTATITDKGFLPPCSLISYYVGKSIREFDNA